MNTYLLSNIFYTEIFDMYCIKTFYGSVVTRLSITYISAKDYLWANAYKCLKFRTVNKYNATKN